MRLKPGFGPAGRTSNSVQRPREIVNVMFLGSYVGTNELPQDHQPRIAFLGRSNVGKSSLINLLIGTRAARVSKTPGRTRALNLFRVNDRWVFGDFPGYGFAKVSKTERAEWQTLVKHYLTAKFFRFAVHIVDARHPGLEPDLQLQDWLRHNRIPNLIVLSKSDKLNQKERADAERKAQEAFSGQPLLFASSITKEGKRELEKTLQNLT